MDPLAPIALGIAPALGWLLWVRWHDRRAPEPRRLVLRAFAAGALRTFLVLWLRPHLELRLQVGNDWHGAMVDAFVLTAPLEESVKLLALLLAVFWHRAWDEPLDGLVYGAAVGLGFAAVENARYLLDSQDATLALMRGVTATLVHLATTGGAGIVLWRARRGAWSRRVAWFAVAWLGAVISHGAYDVFLFHGRGEFGWVSLVIVLPCLLALLALAVARARRRKPLTASSTDRRG